MAKKLSTQAQLKLSVDDALAKIKSLSAELKQVKTQIDQPLKLDVQVDMSKFNNQLNDIKKVLGGSRNAKGQFSTIASDIRAIRTELTNLSKVLTNVVGGLTNASKQANDFSNNLNRSLSGNSQQITGLVNNVEQFNVSIRKSSEEAKTFKNNFMGAFSAASTGLSSLLSGIDKTYSGFRSIGTTFLSMLGNIANQSLEMVGFSVSGMVDEAMEQERKLQQSQIGFGNMFKGQDTNAMISQVRQTAAASPGLNSGDLADYINQLGAVAGGDFTTAFNATMGILKTVSYGGGDANSQMGYIIKNVRDVMAKGKATAVDVQQFNRAMPLLVDSLEAIGASEFLKDGELTITKDNASKLMQAFARLNTADNPAYNIFEQTSKTLAGIQEEFKEATASAIAEGLEGIGFFDALASVAKESLLPEVEGDIKEFFKWVGQVSKEIDWNTLKRQVGAVVTNVKGLIGELATYFKDNFLNTDTLKLAVSIIGEFIKGLLEGAKSFLEMIQGIRQWLGDDGLKNLAGTLGRAVTQGWMLSKVLGLLAGGLETFSHVAQASFFLSQNMGKGAAGAAATATAGGIASKIGGAVSTATGGKIAASTVAGGLTTAATFAKGLLKGGAVTLFTSAASDVVRSFNLLGDASGAVADALKVGGGAIGGAIAGQVLGPLGMLGGALLGAVISIKQMEDAAYEKQAQEDAARGTQKMIEAKDAQREEVLQAAIAVMRESGFTFDERTDAAAWAKSQVADYLNNTEAHDWNADDVYDRLIAAYRQKLGHERMVQADNDDGFWSLQGQEANYISKDDKGEPVLTDWGERLVKLIRDYNLVGYKTQAELENTTDESLVREYLQGDTAKLNTTQIEYLEAQAAKFEEDVGNGLTASKDKIQAAIEAAGGDLSQAIIDAQNASNDSWAAVLEAYRVLQQKAEGVTEIISMATFGDKRWSDETMTELFGGRGKEAINSWGDKGFLWQNGTYFRNVYGTDNIGDLIKQVYDASKIAKIDMNNQALTEDERNVAAQRYEAMDQLLTKFFDTDLGTSGDWDALKEAFAPLTYALGTTMGYKNIGGSDLFDNKLKGPFWNQQAWDAEDWLAWLKAMGYLKNISNGGWAHGGLIKPIYRANGGGTGRGVDIVPAYLQPGEFVQRQSAVQKAGLPVMNALNNGDLSAAYKLIGAKLSNTWNHNRTTNNQSDNRHYQHNNFFIRNNTNAGRAGTRTSLANHLALGY